MKKTRPFSLISILLGLGIGITVLAAFSVVLILTALAAGILLVMPTGELATLQTAATALVIAVVTGSLTLLVYRNHAQANRPRPSLWGILCATCLVSLAWAIVCTVYNIWR